MAYWNIDSLFNHSGQDEQVKCGKQQELSGTEIQQKVKEYNAQINSNLFMNPVSTNKLLLYHCSNIVINLVYHCSNFVINLVIQ